MGIVLLRIWVVVVRRELVIGSENDIEKIFVHVVLVRGLNCLTGGFGVYVILFSF